MNSVSNFIPRSFVALALLIAAFQSGSTSGFAGGFGGPGPFRNGSPLVSGTDGIYQGVATGKNATGLISWAISGGVQTSRAVDNGWTFFVDGQNLGGQTSANISDNKVAGILDSGITSDDETTTAGTSTSSTTSASSTIVVPGNSGSGYFNGSINLNSPVAAFQGKGLITGTPPRTDQIVIIQEARVITVGDSTVFIPAEVIVRSIDIPGSTLQDLKFKIRGTRLTTSSSTTTAAN